MEFGAERAIYLQIADHICEMILAKEVQPFDKISSVRELAVELQVNPNTVVRTFSYLEEKGIIQKQRGIGYFVTDEAYKRTQKLLMDIFLYQKLPIFFRTMSLLNVTFDDLKKLRGTYEKK
jgi:DNA-binding transcriptional regulator YhcF (GntR family)